MRHTRMLLTLALPALVFAWTACTSSSTTLADADLITQDDTLDAAISSAADATAGDVDVLSSAEASLGNNSAAVRATRDAVFSYGAATCALNPSTDRFDCASEIADGLSLTRSFGFFDANGVILPVFNLDLNTALIDMTASESGIRLATDGADTISRTRDFKLIAGLHTTTRTWSGSGSRIDGRVRTDSGVTRAASTSDTSTFDSLVIQLPRSANPWPMSGKITRVVVGTGTVIRNGTTKTFPVSKTVIITFNGRSTVPMTVAGVAFILDLSTGKATRF